MLHPNITLLFLLILLIKVPDLDGIVPFDQGQFHGINLLRHQRDVDPDKSVDRLSRRLLDTVAGKKSIFRERLEEAQFLAELSRKSREEQAEEVRFLRDDPGKHVADALLKQQQNEFEQSHFDPLFPVHNLCGPWNSGSQASNLEWAEPADKLLKLLNSGKQKYNLFMAPGHATNVSVAMYIESMSSFKAQTMDFEVDMYFAMGWYDRRLAHNCTHPLLIAHKPLAERIWTPDLYFLNAKFAYLQEVTTPNFMVIVYPDGLVFKTLRQSQLTVWQNRIFRIDVTLSCNMDLQLFPFDKQECPMVIQSFAYIESMLNLSWHVDPPYYPIATNPDLKLNDMAITGMRFERCSSPYTMFRGTGYIVMKRLVLFHLIQTYIPSGMLVSISWMTFWLDPRASPARISLTITSLLTLTTMSNGARQDLPQVSYIKAMDIWQTFSQALIFLVLLEYSFVSYFHTRRTFRCLHRRQSVIRWSQKGQQQMMRQMPSMATSDDVRLGHCNRQEGATNEGNATNITGNGFTRDFLKLNEFRSTECVNLLRRRRHSAETSQTPPNSAIAATAPPRTSTLDGLEGFRHRKLCAQASSDFDLAGIGGMGEAEDVEEDETAAADPYWTPEKPCQKCQSIDQRRARAIDQYSRFLFPAIFVGFCTLYWLYYLRIMADQ